MFDSSGVAIQDVVCARHAWERATATDTGAVITFADAGVLDDTETAPRMSSLVTTREMHT